MISSRAFLYLSTIGVITTIISLSKCQSVLNMGETDVKRYDTFAMNDDENSTGKNVIKYTRRCGLIMANIVDQITHIYMPGKNLLCIVHNTTKDDCFADAFENFAKLETRNVINVLLGGRNFDSRQVIYQKPTVYFLLGVDLSVILEPLLNFGRIGGTWNPRGLYIGVAQNKEEAADVMAKLWKNYVYKVIVLVFHDKTLDAVEAYTWRPYYPHNYCGPPTPENIVRLGRFTETFEFKKENETEPGITPKRFGNCSLKVSYNIWEPLVNPKKGQQDPGLEVTIIESICKTIGVWVTSTLQIMVFRDQEYEAWAGGYIPLPPDIVTNEVAIPYLQDSLHWYVPHSVEFRLSDLVDAVPFLFWFLSISVMSIVAVSLMAHGKQHWILWVWGSLLEQVDDVAPKKIRSIWTCWLLLSVHLSVVYKTLLISLLTNPMSRDLIKNQTDLINSDLELGFIIEAEMWFDEENEMENKVLERYVLCKTVKECYKEIPMGKKAVFTNNMYVSFLNTQNKGMDSIAEKVRRLPSTMTYKWAMIFSKGHPMLPQFNKFLRFTLEAGLIDYQVQEIENEQTKIKMRKAALNAAKPLSFDNIKSVFQLFFTGLVVATLTFIYEMFRHLLHDKLLNDKLKKK